MSKRHNDFTSEAYNNDDWRDGGYDDYGMDYWYTVSCLHHGGFDDSNNAGNSFAMFRSGYFKAQANCDQSLWEAYMDFLL